jgi:putative tricarboxylic transport membrane protein
MNESSMKKRNLVSGVILLALSMGTFFESRKLEIGALSSAQTGFFPFILSVLLAVLSLILLGQALKGKNEGTIPAWVGKGGWKRLGLTLGILFFFAVSFEYLGYLISTFLLIFILVKAFGNRKWWVAVFFALLSAFGSYLIFGILLKTPLPPGIPG